MGERLAAKACQVVVTVFLIVGACVGVGALVGVLAPDVAREAIGAAGGAAAVLVAGSVAALRG
jgi:hypothetical protein